MKFRQIEGRDDARLAEIVRHNFESHDLVIPGTAYFDKELDHLSDFYLDHPGREYFVVINEDDEVFGGAGYSDFSGMKDCAELQKLYLADERKGMGLGENLLMLVEEKAKQAGYKYLYIETNSVFQAAIGLYNKHGHEEIERPSFVGHEAMDRFFIKNL